MAFTLNSGEFDLGAGFIGRSTILAGETYAIGTATTGVQGLMNTSGLVGVSYYSQIDGAINRNAVSFRSSSDFLIAGR